MMLRQKHHNDNCQIRVAAFLWGRWRETVQCARRGRLFQTFFQFIFILSPLPTPAARYALKQKCFQLCNLLCDSSCGFFICSLTGSRFNPLWRLCCTSIDIVFHLEARRLAGGLTESRRVGAFRSADDSQRHRWNCLARVRGGVNLLHLVPCGVAELKSQQLFFTMTLWRGASLQKHPFTRATVKYRYEPHVAHHIRPFALKTDLPFAEINLISFDTQ